MISKPHDIEFVNREKILEELRGHLIGITTDGTTGAALIQGIKGVGKTRLIRELLKYEVSADFLVLQGKCISPSFGPLHPIRLALDNFYKHGGKLSPAANKKTPRLIDKSGALIGDFLADFPQALSHGSLADPLGVYIRLGEVFQRVAANRPLCLVVEDIGKADPNSLEFLTYLTNEESTENIFILATLDTGNISQTAQSLIDDWIFTKWRNFPLEPFTEEITALFIGVVFRVSTNKSDDVVQKLQKLTGGNALYLTALLPMLNLSMGLELDPTVPMPHSLQNALLRPLRKLDKELREFLQISAVCLHVDPDFTVVRWVFTQDGEDFDRLIVEAERLGILEKSEGDWRFVYDAMRLAIYDDLGQGLRERLHEKAGDWYLKSAGAWSIQCAANHFAQAGDRRMKDAEKFARESAEQASRAGMHRSAVHFYRMVLSDANKVEIGPRLARALIAIGAWSEAAKLLIDLGNDSAEIRMVWSDLHFARREFEAAIVDTELALTSNPEKRVDCLLQLAHIHLYLGNFDRAIDYAREADMATNDSVSDSDRVRTLKVLGATLLHAGKLDEAERNLSQALELFERASEEDQSLYAEVIDNLGQLAESNADWSNASNLHEKARKIRYEAFNALGMLHSLHALARTKLAAGDIQGAQRALDEEARLARKLGNPLLELSKVALIRAKLAELSHEYGPALQQVEIALEGFGKCNTAYDIAHAQLMKARILAAKGEQRSSIQLEAIARTTIARKGFGLLRRIFPGVVFAYDDRIMSGIYAYACGDAFGLPWEGTPPENVDLEQARNLPARADWQRGSTSDDTALTLLTAEALTSATRDPAKTFIQLLSDQALSIRGLGPSTSEAIRVFRETGRLPLTGGETNGAVMRALPIGWMTPIDQPDKRRKMTIAMSRVTHPSPAAICCACVMSACASWALEGADAALLLEVAAQEAREVADSCGAEACFEKDLVSIRTDNWTAPPNGISLDPSMTVAAALACIKSASSLRSGIEAALALGGDTDTVAALVAGLMGCQLEMHEIDEILPWKDKVILPESGRVRDLAFLLSKARLEAADFARVY